MRIFPYSPISVEFLIVKDGQQLGPLTMDQVNAQLAGGMIDPEDLCWCEGFDDWYPLNQVEGFIVPDTQLATEVPVPETAVEPAVVEESAAAESAAPAPGRRGAPAEGFPARGESVLDNFITTKCQTII